MLSFSKSALCLLLASPLIATVIATGCTETPNSGGSAGTGTTQSSSSGGDTGGGGTGGSVSTGGSGGASGGAGGTGGIATGGAGGAGGWGGSGPPVIVNCQNQTYLCGDTLDNDGDGLIDWQDPDCLGPCDNTENGLNLGIPGGDGAACIVDCYWDSNSGAGNDGCYWNHRCDTKSPEGADCPYNMNANTPGTGLSCSELENQQPASCLGVCPKLVPNGCDCFGCCVLYKGGMEYGPVWLGTEDANGNFTCQLSALGTADQDKACAPCTQVKNECYNGCGTCELCIGKDTLPPECFPPPPPDGGVDSGTPPPPDSGVDSGVDSGTPPPPPPQCPPDLQPCGLQGQELCPVGYSCLTGCCIQNPK